MPLECYLSSFTLQLLVPPSSHRPWSKTGLCSATPQWLWDVMTQHYALRRLFRHCGGRGVGTGRMPLCVTCTSAFNVRAYLPCCEYSSWSKTFINRTWLVFTFYYRDLNSSTDHTHTCQTFGERAFSYAGTKLWNSLPSMTSSEVCSNLVSTLGCIHGAKGSRCLPPTPTLQIFFMTFTMKTQEHSNASTPRRLPPPQRLKMTCYSWYNYWQMLVASCSTWFNIKSDTSVYKRTVSIVH